jgi:hypothetical protein
MIGDLVINGKDAQVTWNVRMGANFLDALLVPPPLKPLVENKGSWDDGKEVIYIDEPPLDTRDVTLSFYITGDNKLQFFARKQAFETELLKGKVEIKVPTVLPATVFNLTYLSSASFAISLSKTSCTISVKFNEPNPALRVPSNKSDIK